MITRTMLEQLNNKIAQELKTARIKRLKRILCLCEQEIKRVPIEEERAREENEMYADMTNFISSLKTVLGGK